MIDQVSRDFDAGAARYDLLVALNPGYHNHLNRAATELISRLPGGSRLIDVGCGSGASTAALLRAAPSAPILGIDASAGMLAQAQAKPWPSWVRFLQGRAGCLADLIPGEQRPHGMLAAYLFRNVPADQRDAALADAHEVLADDGWLMVVEYSVAGRPRAEALWNLICRTVILPLATLTGGNPALYRYLQQSVLEFDTTAAFADRMVRAGFTDVAVATVPGWQKGILHLFRGRKDAR
ncbi:MAG: class I SAM-dependent methyltransferase [Micropruina sp.]|nr:class I SAM-dependent methyltransferase [Micropruina sp.]